MVPLRIVVLGNSVALRIRPPRDIPGERTYAEWLRHDGHEVTVSARGGVLLSEAFATLEDDVICRFPDWVIVNHGVVEACPRRTVRWINNRTIENYYLNAPLGRPYSYANSMTRARQLLWRLANGSIRRLAGLLGLRWHWASPARFLEVLERTIGVILKETHAEVIVLGLNPASGRVEEQLPGSIAAIGAVNSAMARMSGRLGPRVRFVDPHQYLSGLPAERVVPDGIHFSAEGHHLTAERLRAVLAAEGGGPGGHPA